MALVATHILSDETGKDIVSAINLIVSKICTQKLPPWI